MPSQDPLSRVASLIADVKAGTHPGGAPPVPQVKMVIRARRDAGVKTGPAE